MFHMTDDSDIFRTHEQLEADGWRLEGNIFRKDGTEYLPLYEAKMIHHFDHHWGTYDGQTEAQANQGKLPELDEEMHANSELFALPRYWGQRHRPSCSDKRTSSRSWLFGFRNITGATVIRTIIATPTPMVAVGHSMPLIYPAIEATQCAALVALLASFAADYTMRQKLGGINLTFSYFNQLPTPPPEEIVRPCPWADRRSLSAAGSCPACWN